MQQFFVLFREPDGRKDQHTPEATTLHRNNWRLWMEKMHGENRIAGGMPLTLAGRIIKGQDGIVTEGPHTVGEEIVGGYLLINAANVDEAAALIKTCPIFEFGGYAEVREIMNMPTANPSASASPGKTPPSIQEKNKAIVRRFNTAFIQEGDTAAFHEIVDRAVVNHTARPGFSKDADGIFTVIELFRKSLSGLQVRILRQVAEDDIVVTYKTFHAIHTGELMGIPPSGKPIVINTIDIIRLRDGKYVEHWAVRSL